MSILRELASVNRVALPDVGVSVQHHHPAPDTPNQSKTSGLQMHRSQEGNAAFSSVLFTEGGAGHDHSLSRLVVRKRRHHEICRRTYQSLLGLAPCKISGSISLIKSCLSSRPDTRHVSTDLNLRGFTVFHRMPNETVSRFHPRHIFFGTLSGIRRMRDFMNQFRSLACDKNSIKSCAFAAFCLSV